MSSRIVAAALFSLLSLSTAVSSPAVAQHNRIFSPATTTAEDPIDPTPVPPPPGPTDPSFALHF